MGMKSIAGQNILKDFIVLNGLGCTVNEAVSYVKDKMVAYKFYQTIVASAKKGAN